MKNRDEFDDPKGNDLLGSVGPKAAFFIVLIALSFMIGVVWKIYAGGDSENVSNVPIIRAEAEPYKVMPDEAGGMDMPHKDSTIFSSLNSDPDADSGIENLLADDTDEQPVPRSQLFAGLNTEPSPDLHAEAQETPLDQPLSEDEERIVDQAKDAKKVVTSLIEDGADAIDNASPSDMLNDNDDKVIESTDNGEVTFTPEVDTFNELAQEQDLINKVPEKIEPAAAPVTIDTSSKAIVFEKEPEPAPKKVEPKPEPAKIAAVPAKEKPKAMASGDYYVQLASVQDKSRADAEWKKLKSKYGSALSSYDYRIQTATLSKGTFHRIQAGPVSKAQANQTCAAIKRINANGCLVKKK